MLELIVLLQERFLAKSVGTDWLY